MEARVVYERRFVSRSPGATEALGERLGSCLAAGTVVALVGELGSGKTCIARGIARGLGVADEVQSPSFTLMHVYDGRVPVYHFDAWMQGRETAFLEGGGAEWLEAGGVALVEWAERVAEWLPLPRLELRLEHASASPSADSRSKSDSNVRSICLRILGRISPASEADSPNALVELVRGSSTPAGIEEGS